MPAQFFEADVPPGKMTANVFRQWDTELIEQQNYRPWPSGARGSQRATSLPDAGEDDHEHGFAVDRFDLV